MKKIFLFVSFLALSWATPLPAVEKSFPLQASPEQFAAWQLQAREFFSEALYHGLPPKASPLLPQPGKEERRDKYQLQEITFHDRPGHVTHGWLARPLAPPASKLPAVLALHGHDWHAYDTFHPENMYYYGDLLARQGYIVLALDMEHESLTGIHPRWIHFQWPLPRHFPFPPMGQRVWMARRGIDFLQSLPEVDPQKIGVVGLSNGGLTALFLAAVDERIQLGISSGALILHHRMWHSTLIHCRCQYLAEIDGKLDYYDIAALIAPRPLLIQSGERDPIFPIQSARRAFALVQQAYLSAQAPDQVRHDIHPGAHVFAPETPLVWFQKYLPLPAESAPAP